MRRKRTREEKFTEQRTRAAADIILHLLHKRIREKDAEQAYRLEPEYSENCVPQ
jgi:hypothetical protein